MRKITLFALAGLFVLAACERSEPPEAPAENNVIEVPVEPAPGNNVVELPQANAANETEPAAPPPEFTDEEQMLDDADAVGLTARLPDPAAEPADETAPAE